MHPVPLRPLSFGEILDGAFVLYRRHFGVLLAASSVAFVPAVAGWLLAPSAAGYAVLLSLAEMAGMFIASAVVTHLVAAAYTGSEPDLRASCVAVRDRLGSILATCAVVTALTLFGIFLLVIPGLIVIARYFAVVPVAVIERLGWRETRRRARDLSRDAEMEVLGVISVAMLIYFLPYFAAGLVDLRSLVGAGGMRTLETAWGILSTPVTTGIYVLLYFDRRVRTEGLDVQQALAAA